MSNKARGTAFEKELAKILAERGWWVHLLQGNSNGQPADMIAVKNDHVLLIDAKLCQNDVFQMNRIEENQKWAMRKYLDCGNRYACFAIKFERHDEIYFMSYEYLASLNEKSLHYKMAKANGILLERRLTQ